MIPQFIAGEKNIADYLSRCLKIKEYVQSEDIPVDCEIDRIIKQTEYYISMINNKVFIENEITMKELIDATNSDKTLQTIIKHIKNNHKFLPKKNTQLNGYRTIYHELNISPDGLLLKNDLIVIPTVLIQTVINNAHAGHQGINSIKRLINNNFYFPNMDKLVKEKCESCIACQANTDKTRMLPMIPTVLPQHSWEFLATDFSSKTPSNDYLLVIVCERSRYPVLRISKGLTSKDAIKILREVFAEFGVPKRLKSDNGPAFISKEFEDFAREMGFKHDKITPLWPRANGCAERTMKIINKIIRCASVEKIPWKTILNKWLKRYRATPHSSTKLTPNEMMNLNDDIDMPSVKSIKSKSLLNKAAKYADVKAKQTMKKYADLNVHSKSYSFKVNDTVLVKKERSNKFDSLLDPNPKIYKQ